MSQTRPSEAVHFSFKEIRLMQTEACMHFILVHGLLQSNTEHWVLFLYLVVNSNNLIPLKKQVEEQVPHNGLR